MKRVLPRAILGAALLSLAPATLLAADHDHHNMDHMAPAAAAPAVADGTVKKIDRAGGKITLAHGPLTSFNMPAMTMAFRVKDAAWLDQMKDGDKLRFTADKVDGAFTIIHFEQAK